MTWHPGSAWLFCPADRPTRYAKALAIADVVVLDLEDAVSPSAKAVARDCLRGLVEAGLFDAQRTVVRVNGALSADHAADVFAVKQLGIRRVMLPKSEPGIAAPLLGDMEVIALLETAAGIANVREVLASGNVIGAMWGAEDLVASLGGTASRRSDGSYRDVARYARSATLVAAKAIGLLALDAVFMDLGDVESLRQECEDAAAVGFDGSVAIHPSQVAVIRRAYVPSPERVEWATRLLAAANDGGVATFEGRMVDGPVFKQAQRILRLAEIE